MSKVDPKKLKRVIEKLKQKKAGSKKHKEKKVRSSSGEVSSRKDPQRKKPVLTGPQGGSYIQSDTGKRYYLQSEKTRVYHRVKKAIESSSARELLKSIIKEAKIIQFIQKFKKEKNDE